MSLWASALPYGRMIKFSHSISALPFAFSGAALAAKENKADLIAGINLARQSSEVATILIDLAQRETMNESAVLAKSLTGALRGVPRKHAETGARGGG